MALAIIEGIEQRIQAGEFGLLPILADAMEDNGFHREAGILRQGLALPDGWYRAGGNIWKHSRGEWKCRCDGVLPRRGVSTARMIAWNGDPGTWECQGAIVE